MMALEADKLTLDAFMTQLGTHGKSGVASEILSRVEQAAKRIKKDYGLSVDDAEYILKDNQQEVGDIGTADAIGDARFVKSYITTISKDRDMEAILPEGMDATDYNKIVLWSHRYNELGMGRCLWIKPNEKGAIERIYGLLSKTIYASAKANSFADQVYQWQVEKMPMGKSIGFVPLDWITPDDKGWEKAHDSWSKRVIAFTKSRGLELAEGALDGLIRIFLKWAILEYSDVMVPSNQDCVLMARSKGMLLESEVDRYTIKAVEFDDSEMVSKEIIEKPFENEHSCRLEEPEDFDKFARKNCYLKHDEKCIDVVFGIKAGKSKIQAYRYPKDIWTEDAAKNHCKSKDGLFEAAKKTAEQELQTQEGGHLFSEEELRRIADEILDQEDAGSKEDFFGQRKPLRNDFDAAVNRDGMWNKSLPKSFDIAQYDEANTVFRYSLFTKFLECEVKHIYVNSYDIPSPLIGTYLQAISEVTAGLTIDDTRRFSYDGKESPPSRDYIQLNSRERKRFLVNGSEYCHDNDMALIKDFSPGWRGLQFSIITSSTNEGRNDAIMDAIHLEADRNHMLKGEKFALSGEFLSSTDDAWDGLVIDNKDKQAITKSMEITSKADGNSRGLLFVGPPGTGKTKTGRTIMNDTSHTFIWLSTRDFTYGWPEAILRLAFNMSRKLAPTVLFMEDVDNYLDTDLLKTELDGLKQNKGIMTILTTNHPEKLPKALLDRPGRFHHVILFDLPDEGQRRQMFRLWAGEIEKSILDKLIDATEGFSGAHINHLIEYSKIISEDEDIDIDLALVESMLRLSAQMELVAGLQPEQSKSVEDSSDITPDEALALLRLDAEEKAAAARLTADDMMREMQGRAD